MASPNLLKFRRDFEASWQWTRHGGRAELKDGDRAEGGAEGGLPQRSFGGQAAVEEVPQYHHRPSPGSMLDLMLQKGELPYSWQITLKPSEKIHRISICYYRTQLGSLPTFVINKLTN